MRTATCLILAFLLLLSPLSVHSAEQGDVTNTFSLSKNDVVDGTQCPKTVVHSAVEGGGGYLRIPHASIRMGDSRCTSGDDRAFTPLLDAPTFENVLRRHVDLFPIANNVDRGLLGRLRRARTVIGIQAYGNLQCGVHNFRRGTVVLVVRNATESLSELGLDGLVSNETYLALFETNVRAPKRCVYRAVKPESQLTKDFSSVERIDCFPAATHVHTLHGTVRMDALTHGTVLRHAGVEPSGSPVYAFSHRDSTSVARYMRFTTTTGAQLTVSPGHYVFSDGVMRVAHSVSVGDVLDTASGSARVTVVERSVLARGRYNPHTFEGEFLVDGGFRVSSYTSALHPYVAHRALAPVRLVWRLTGRTPLRFLHGESKARRLVKYLPSGPLTLRWTRV